MIFVRGKNSAPVNPDLYNQGKKANARFYRQCRRGTAVKYNKHTIVISE